MRLLGNIFVVDPLPVLSDCPSPRVDLRVLSGAARPSLAITTRLGLFCRRAHFRRSTASEGRAPPIVRKRGRRPARANDGALTSASSVRAITPRRRSSASITSATGSSFGLARRVLGPILWRTFPGLAGNWTNRGARLSRHPQACLRASVVARPSVRDLDGLRNARRSLIKLGRSRVFASAER